MRSHQKPFLCYAVFVVGLMKRYMSSSSVCVFSCIKEQCSCNTSRVAAEMCFLKLHIHKLADVYMAAIKNIKSLVSVALHDKAHFVMILYNKC